jgi:hypothetical protein
MGFITIHEDLFSFLGAATAAWKRRLLCFAGVFGITALAAFYNWWRGLAIIPTILAERHFAKKQREFYTLIAALMLALEMVVNDVSGFGRTSAGCMPHRGHQDASIPPNLPDAVFRHLLAPTR